jgi:hypothetical protein
MDKNDAMQIVESFRSAFPDSPVTKQYTRDSIWPSEKEIESWREWLSNN